MQASTSKPFESAFRHVVVDRRVMKHRTLRRRGYFKEGRVPATGRPAFCRGQGRAERRRAHFEPQIEHRQCRTNNGREAFRIVTTKAPSRRARHRFFVRFLGACAGRCLTRSAA